MQLSLPCLKRIGEYERETPLALLVWSPRERCEMEVMEGPGVRVARGVIV